MWAKAACLAVLASGAQAESLNFCWTGAGGYTMTGRMTIPDDRMFDAVITEQDVTAFKISGYHRGQLIGTWDASQRTDNTTFHLRFDPLGMTFLTGGSFPGTMSQGWNANGEVTDCGIPGFGFNSGNFAQDVCVNGTYVEASSIAPETSFMATRRTVSPDCRELAPTSKSTSGNKKD